MSKPMFGAGDFVEVSAVIVTTRVYRDPPLDKQVGMWDRSCHKKLTRKLLDFPVRGWVVGAVRRCEGVLKGPTSSYDERPYLQVTSSRVLWKVAKSMLNTPMEVDARDIRLLGQGVACVLLNNGDWEPINQSPIPMLLGTPWSDDYGDARGTLRGIMAKWPRDAATGRWLPKRKP